MGKWDREQTAKEDTQQAIFADGQVKLRPRSTVKVTAHSKTAMCPFCFHAESLDKFAVSTKKGFHRSLGCCPACNKQSQLRNLTAAWTPEGFAEWVYDYRADGFWRKVTWPWFKAGLKRLGWTDRFWTKYKTLRGTSSEEDEKYEDYAASMRASPP